MTITEVVEGEVVRTGSEWADVIRADLGRAVEGIVSAGKHLIAAKADVQHGEWLPLLQEVGISHSAAKKLMAVGRNAELSNGSSSNHLPASLDALYTLSRLAPEVIESGIERGDIHPAMTIKDAKGYAQEHIERPVKREPEPMHEEGSGENDITDLVNGTRNDLAMIATTYGRYVTGVGRDTAKRDLPEKAVEYILDALRDNLATIEEKTNRAIAQIEGE